MTSALCRCFHFKDDHFLDRDGYLSCAEVGCYCRRFLEAGNG